MNFSVHEIPSDLMRDQIFSFCEIEDLFKISRVSKSWRDAVNSDHYCLWKYFAGKYKITCPINASPQKLKSLCNPIKGNLHLKIPHYNLIFHLHNFKDDKNEYSWGQESELVVSIWAVNHKSRIEQIKKFGNNMKGIRGSWERGYSKLTGKSFPSFLPLRFFLDQNGSPKNEGFYINLNFDGRLISLKVKPKVVKQFKDHFDRAQKFSSLLKKHLKESQESAKKSSDKWFYTVTK